MLQPYEKTNIELDAYEISNLRAALEAIGYRPHLGMDKRCPLWALNNGDWVGQIYNKLPESAIEPNDTAQELVTKSLSKHWNP